jgi:hypothetical protein
MDDWMETRRPWYEKFLSATSDASGIRIVPFFVERPTDVPRLMSEHVFSLALIDAVLDEPWAPEFDLRWAVDAIANTAFILVSIQWNRVRHVNEIWKHPRCHGFIHWRDLESRGPEGFDYAVAHLAKIVCDISKTKNLDGGLEPNAPLSILHITDLQIGGFADETMNLEASNFAARIKEELNGAPPSFLAVTGDIAHTGKPLEYEGAKKWLNLVCRRLGFEDLIPCDRLLLCPGNHDVNLSLAAAARVRVASDPKSKKLKQILESKTVDAAVLPYALRPYQDFSNAVSNHELVDESSWVELRFRHLGIVFFGLQSLHLRADGPVERRLNPQSLERVKSRIQKSIEGLSSRPLVIGLVHHCPVDGSGDSAIDNPADVNAFLSGSSMRTGAFLYGHVHKARPRLIEDGDHRLLLVAASTPYMQSKSRDQDTLRGFNLYTFEREGHVVKSMTVKSFSLSSQRLFQEFEPKKYVLSGDGMFMGSVGS